MRVQKAKPKIVQCVTSSVSCVVEDDRETSSCVSLFVYTEIIAFIKIHTNADDDDCENNGVARCRTTAKSSSSQWKMQFVKYKTEVLFLNVNGGEFDTFSCIFLMRLPNWEIDLIVG